MVTHFIFSFFVCCSLLSYFSFPASPFCFGCVMFSIYVFFGSVIHLNFSKYLFFYFIFL